VIPNLTGVCVSIETNCEHYFVVVGNLIKITIYIVLKPILLVHLPSIKSGEKVQPILVTYIRYAYNLVRVKLVNGIPPLLIIGSPTTMQIYIYSIYIWFCENRMRKSTNSFQYKKVSFCEDCTSLIKVRDEKCK